jgi:hypothetical protein
MSRSKTASLAVTEILKSPSFRAAVAGVVAEVMATTAAVRQAAGAAEEPAAPKWRSPLPEIEAARDQELADRQRAHAETLALQYPRISPEIIQGMARSFAERDRHAAVMDSAQRGEYRELPPPSPTPGRTGRGEAEARLFV